MLNWFKTKLTIAMAMAGAVVVSAQAQDAQQTSHKYVCVIKAVDWHTRPIDTDHSDGYYLQIFRGESAGLENDKVAKKWVKKSELAEAIDSAPLEELLCGKWFGRDLLGIPENPISENYEFYPDGKVKFSRKNEGSTTITVTKISDGSAVSSEHTGIDDYGDTVKNGTWEKTDERHFTITI